MKDQKITRKNLITLYTHFKSCSKWKDIIAESLISNAGTSITVSGSKLQEAYNEANDTQKKLIEKYFKIEKPVDVSSKYDTWAKIVKKEGEKNCKLPYSNPKTLLEKSINARVMFSIIIKVYNNDHKFNFKLSETRYWIYKYLSHDGLVSYSFYWDCDLVGPVDLAIKGDKTCKAIIKNFPEVINDYFMIK